MVLYNMGGRRGYVGEGKGRKASSFLFFYIKIAESCTSYADWQAPAVSGGRTEFDVPSPHQKVLD